MDEEFRNFSEYDIQQDPLEKSLALSNLAFQNAIKELDTKDSERYNHLDSIVDPARILPFEDAEMTDNLIKLGCEKEKAKSIPAIYLGKRGDIVVDVIAIRKGSEIKPLIMLHELIHRAADQRGLTGKNDIFLEQIYTILDFSEETRKDLKNKSKKKYENKLETAKSIAKSFTEGITQWATLYLANKTQEYNPPVDDKAYLDEVAAINESFDNGLSEKGLSQEQIDKLKLDIALTGDFSKFKNAVKSEGSSIERGFTTDFIVSQYIKIVQDDVLLKKYNRILEHNKEE